MDVHCCSTGDSAFMVSHLPCFFARFGINFSIDGPQFEYFVYEIKSGKDISCSLTVSLDGPAHLITVMTFYPGISHKRHTRYLSAVCFFLVLQHFANYHRLGPEFLIAINTREAIFKAFFSRLQDFSFQILHNGKAERIDITSRLLPLGIDTSMITERPLVYED